MKQKLAQQTKYFNSQIQYFIILTLCVITMLFLVPQDHTQAAILNGVAQSSNGNWYYYQNNKVVSNFNSLAQYNGSWWYFKNGKLNFQYTGLCQYNGSWWYVQNGKVNFRATTLCQYNGSWWYVQNGKVNFSATTLCQYNGIWWYVQNGKVNFNATTLCQYNGTWWYVQNGQVNFKATTLCQYNRSWWYVQNGKVNFGYNGTNLLYNDAIANTTKYMNYYKEVLRLVNEIRAGVGVSPVKLDTSLCQAATIRATEMDYANCFSHTRPNGQSCFSVLTDCGIKYRSAGENIAAGYTSPKAVVDGWRNSPGHYKIMINSSFTKLGVGYSDAGSSYYNTNWVQIFSN